MVTVHLSRAASAAVITYKALSDAYYCVVYCDNVHIIIVVRQ